MGKLSIDSATLTGIADAIREKAKTTDLIATNKMRESILAIKGGLALDVVTAASLPSTVVDGQIVVITDTAAGTVYIDTDEPGSPVSGGVWVRLGGGVDVALLLTEESPYLRGGLASSKVWNGSEWDTVKGYFGEAGTWQQFSFDMPAVGTSLNDMTWEQVSLISRKGLARTYFKIGDAKQLTINGKIGNAAFNNLTLWAFIIGFDHNSTYEGGNLIHFQIGKSAQTGGLKLALADSQYNTYPAETGYFTFNHTQTNAGGWEASAMRTALLGSASDPRTPVEGSFMAALPIELRDVMKPVTKYTDNVGNKVNTQATITATTDYLWLLSEFEVLGSRTYANSYEKNYQKQYEFYSAGNDKNFYKHDTQSVKATWWLRSPHYGGTAYFCDIYQTGGADNSPANYDNALAPGFCV